VRVAVVSDLHLCSQPRVCEFTHSEARMLALMDRLEAEHAAILVPGDIYNLDHGWLPVGRGVELRATQRAFPRLTRRLHAPPCIAVHGNHDSALRRLAHIPEVALLELGGRRILMLHGHQYDGRLKQLPGVSATGSWLAAWLRRARLGRVANRLVRIGVWTNQIDARFRAARGLEGADITDAGEPEPHDVRAARKLLERHDVDVVVMGHTHRARQRRFSADEDGVDGLYVNAGSCAFGRLEYSSVDLEQLEVTHEVLEDGPGLPVTLAH